MFEEKIIWHEITTRPLTNEEKAEYSEKGYSDYEIPEYMFSCEMPKDGQDILIATNWGVSQDLCMIHCRECKEHRLFNGRDMCAKNATIFDGHEVGLRATRADFYCADGERRTDE